MNDLSQHDETAMALRSAFEDVHYSRDVPTQRGKRTLSIWIGVGVAVVVLVGSFWLMSGDDNVAWAAVGRYPTAAESSLLIKQCGEHIDGMTDPEGIELLSLPPLMAGEVRGRTAFFVFASDTHFVTCVSLDVTSMNPDDPPVDVVSVATVDDLKHGAHPLLLGILKLGISENDPGPTTFVTGVVDEQVERVVIETSSLGKFEATISNGWFTAWWPTTESFETVAYDFDGFEVARQNVD